MRAHLLSGAPQLLSVGFAGVSVRAADLDHHRALSIATRLSSTSTPVYRDASGHARTEASGLGVRS